MSGTKGCSEAALRQSVARVREYLFNVVQEIRWADGLNPFNYCPHFPFFVAHFTNSTDPHQFHWWHMCRMFTM